MWIPPDQRLNWRTQALWIIALASVLAILFQGTRGVWGTEEGRFTNVAVQMIETGDWLQPKRHPEQTGLTGPPMTYWVLALSMEVFGRNEWALRIPSAMAFIGTAFLMLLLGRRLVPRRPWLGPLVFVSSFVPFAAANLINPDFVLTFWLTLSMVGYVELWHARDDDSASRARLLFWAALGAAFLTKGWIALLPLGSVVLYRRLLGSTVPALITWPALAAFLMIALPWYAMLIVQEPALLSHFVGNELYGRIFTDIHDKNPEWYGGFVVYGPIFLIGTLPWGLFVWRRSPDLIGEITHWRHVLYRKIHRERLFLLCWLVLPLLILFLCRSRMPLYVLPYFVPWALLVARLMERSKPARYALYAFPLWLGLLLLIKGYAGIGFDYQKDTRDMARQIERDMPQLPSTVVFVDEAALYGLGFYLGAPVERVRLQDAARANVDGELIDSLRTADADRRLWVMTAESETQFREQAAALGFRVVLVSRSGAYFFFRLEPVG